MQRYTAGVLLGVRFRNATANIISVPTHAWRSPRGGGSWSAGYVIISTTFLPGEVSGEISDVKEKDRYLKAGMEPWRILTCWERILEDVW